MSSDKDLKTHIHGSVSKRAYPLGDFEREAASLVEDMRRSIFDRVLADLHDVEGPTKAEPVGVERALPIAVDERPWVPLRVADHTEVNTPRSGPAYAAVLDALPLLESPRYQPRAGLTFCNIYVWDATCLLGCEVPHWVEKWGTIALPGRGREQTANDMADWLSDHGQKHGWGPCGPATAQLMASRGNPAVAVWRNPGGTGHIAMVRPGEFDPVKGPCIAQAGKRNFRTGHVLDGFGAGRPVEYFVHLLTSK